MQSPTPVFYHYHSHPIRENDVICGKKCEKHPGNKAFRRIVGEYRNQYQATSHREVKKQIIEAVIQRVNATGGHFLKESPDQRSMEVVPSSYIYEKVSHALRSSSSSSSSARIGGSNNNDKAISAAAAAADTTMGIFDNLLAIQQRLFYSYLMAATTTTSSDTATTTDDDVDDDDHTTVMTTGSSSSSDEENNNNTVPLSLLANNNLPLASAVEKQNRKLSFCDIVDQTTINILLNLHEV